MAGVPFFIETVTSDQNASLQVCRKIRTELFKARIAPLPFASNITEIADVLNTLNSRGIAPAVFVVNTFWADELLSRIDPFMGQSPVVYLRRQLYTHSSSQSAADACLVPTTSAILGKMTPRLSVKWAYGSQTADEVAIQGARALLRFLQHGDFSVLEDYAHTQTYEMLKSRSDNGAGLARCENGKVIFGAKPPETGASPVPPAVPPEGDGLAAAPPSALAQPSFAEPGRKVALER